MLTNKKGPEGRALILLFIFNPRFCDYLHSAGGGVKYPKAEFVQNLALSSTKFLLKNKTISDGGITVDFSIIKVDTSN